MDKNHDLLITVISKCKNFCGSALINRYIDSSKTSHNYTRKELLSLLAGAEIDWDHCFLDSKPKQICFKRTNDKSIEKDWTFTMF